MSLQERWAAFYREGSGGLELLQAELVAAGNKPKEVRLAREHALEVHLWGAKIPADVQGVAPGAFRAQLQKARPA